RHRRASRHRSQHYTPLHTTHPHLDKQCGVPGWPAQEAKVQAGRCPACPAKGPATSTRVGWLARCQPFTAASPAVDAPATAIVTEQRQAVTTGPLASQFPDKVQHSRTVGISL